PVDRPRGLREGRGHGRRRQPRGGRPADARKPPVPGALHLRRGARRLRPDRGLQLSVGLGDRPRRRPRRRARRYARTRRYARSAWISPLTGLISSGASLPRRAPPPLWETSRAASTVNMAGAKAIADLGHGRAFAGLVNAAARTN